MWANIKRSNRYKFKKKRKTILVQKKILEEIMATKSPNLVKDINLQNQEAQSSSTENHAQTNHSLLRTTPSFPPGKNKKLLKATRKRKKKHFI